VGSGGFSVNARLENGLAILVWEIDSGESRLIQPGVVSLEFSFLIHFRSGRNAIYRGHHRQ
jgi:hypothetical protein